MRSLFALFFVAIVLSGCVSNDVTITRAQTHGRYRMTEIQWAGANRDFKVVVRNNPYQIPQDELDRIVTASIQRGITFMRTNFTTAPGESARQDFRVEFFFYPPINIGGTTLCDSNRTLPQAEPRQDAVVVLGALCLRDSFLSEGRATVGAAEPGDERFDRLFVQLIRTLMPQVRENRRRNCRPPRCR